MGSDRHPHKAPVMTSRLGHHDEIRYALRYIECKGAATSLPLWGEKERRQCHEGVNANDGNLFLSDSAVPRSSFIRMASSRTSDI